MKIENIVIQIDDKTTFTINITDKGLDEYQFLNEMKKNIDKLTDIDQTNGGKLIINKGYNAFFIKDENNTDQVKADVVLVYNDIQDGKGLDISFDKNYIQNHKEKVKVKLEDNDTYISAIDLFDIVKISYDPDINTAFKTREYHIVNDIIYHIDLQDYMESNMLTIDIRRNY